MSNMESHFWKLILKHYDKRDPFSISVKNIHAFFHFTLQEKGKPRKTTSSKEIFVGFSQVFGSIRH